MPWIVSKIQKGECRFSDELAMQKKKSKITDWNPIIDYELPITKKTKKTKKKAKKLKKAKKSKKLKKAKKAKKEKKSKKAKKEKKENTISFEDYIISFEDYTDSDLKWLEK